MSSNVAPVVTNYDHVSPIRPWQASVRDRLITAGIFLGSLALSYLVIKITGLSGKLGFFATFLFIFTTINAIRDYLRFGSASAKDTFVSTLVAAGAFITIVPIASILFTVISKGMKGIYVGLFFRDMSLNAPNDPLNVGGLAHSIIGTLLLVSIALVFSVPIGILTALYLTEIKGKFSQPIRFLVQAMSGVPSIVAGLFIYSAILIPITQDNSSLLGSLSLTILMIPTVARTAEEVLNLIPNDLREAGIALGGTQWRTVAMIVVPAAKSGLITAIILGIARIAGETAPVLLLAGGGDKFNFNPTSGPMGSLPYYIWRSFGAGSPEAVTRAWTGLFVLLVIVFALFAVARFLGNRKVGK
jgi:phosphate transport system permease protein